MSLCLLVRNCLSTLLPDESIGEREAAVPTSDTANAHDTLPKVAVPRVTHDLEYFGNVAGTVTQRNTATGVDMALPYRNATGEGKILTAQGTAVGAVGTNDPGEFKAVVFKALTSHSDRLALQRELVQDSGIDLRAEMVGEGMRRIAASWNSAEMERPSALDNVMTGMIDMAAGNSVSFPKGAPTTDSFVDLTYAIDEAYTNGGEGNPDGWQADANGGMIGFMLHRDMVKAAQKLKDNANRPIWQPATSGGLASGRGALILGYPYRINGAGLKAVAAGSTTGDVSGLFYNGAYFAERRVGAPEVHVFMGSPELEKNQIVYLIVQRRFFGPIGALSAGTGTDTATRSHAIAQLASA